MAARPAPRQDLPGGAPMPMAPPAPATPAGAGRTLDDDLDLQRYLDSQIVSYAPPAQLPVAENIPFEMPVTDVADPAALPMAGLDQVGVKKAGMQPRPSVAPGTPALPIAAPAQLPRP